MNMGWECPGLEIVAMQVRNLSLTAESASDVGFLPGSRSPAKFVLYPNNPNPFNLATTIRYEIPAAASVKLSVFDLNGREVAILANSEQGAGSYQLPWNAAGFASGIYICKLQIGSRISYRKMLLVK